MTLPPPASAVTTHFDSTWGSEPDGIWFAPGRVNIIGEHTDYNDGFVLPMALPYGVAVAARGRSDGVVRARSMQLDQRFEFKVADLEPGSVSGWGAYVAGVAWALRDHGIDSLGADLLLCSDVPSGAGLSSSHALEVSVASALLGLAEQAMGRTELAKLVRVAENDFVGAPTGIMDQMASVHGRAGHVLLIDTRSLSVEAIAWELERHQLVLQIIDTRTPHSLVSGEYAERRASCQAGADALGVDALRDISVDQLPESLSGLDPLIARRVRHVVSENARVLKVAKLLADRVDPREIGPLLTASHTSMREDFEITVDTVDRAVEASLAAGAHGARMTGGGFGGCVVALVDADKVSDLRASVEQAFSSSGFRAPSFIAAVASRGARQLR